MHNIPDHIKINLSICKSCTLYKPGFTTFVPPDGPTSGTQLIKCGEAPGASEVKQGIPFCGKAGIEDTRYSKESGIYRHNTYVTNICKCRPPENRDPTEHEISCCSYILKQELEQVRTQYIACLGRIASKYFLGQNIDMEAMHGIPFYCDFLPDNTYIGHRVVIPMYHPAYGLHDSRNMIFVDSDYKALARTVYGYEIPRQLSYDAGKNKYYQEIEDYDELPAILQSVYGKYDKIAIDTETENDKPWCLTFSVKEKDAYLIKATNRETLNVFNKKIEDMTVILHNAKYDIPILESMGIYINKFEDTMIMAYLLQDIPKGLKPLADRLAQIKMEDYTSIISPAQETKSLCYLISILEHPWPDPAPIKQILSTGKEHIKHPQNITKKVKRILNDYQKNPALDLWARWHNIALDAGRKQVEDKLGPMLQATLADIPFKDALKYAGRDASATMAIYPYLKQRIIDEGLLETYERDLGIIRWLNMAESHGMKIDKNYLIDLTKYFNTTMDELRTEIELIYSTETGQEYKNINPGSTQQTAKILYDLGLIKSPKESTDSYALDHIRIKHNIINLITQYRELSKLKGTYSEKLPLNTDKNDMIHTHINNTKTATGSLSSSDPNLQNIPMRTETGRKIKKAFIAPDGYYMLSSDYSQIEMRLTSHDSQDSVMLKIFRNDEDIHTKTASWIFDKPEQDVDPQLERYPVKRVGFGIIYGISGAGLGDIMRAEGQNESDSYWDNLIREWFKIYKGVKRFMSDVQFKARNTGRIYDFCGRYRLLPGAKSNLKYIKNKVMRQAVNVPAQSGAGQIIKEAMKQLLEFYTNINKAKNRLVIQPVMQIHDDLLHYVSEDQLYYVAEVIKVVMESAIKLSVPVRVDQKYGHNWLEMEKIV